MNFKNIFKGFAAAALAVAAIVACQKTDEANTLSVTPDSAIEFAATDNQPVVLNVNTNAREWSFTAPEWIEAVKGETSLSVNAKDNTTGEELLGRITISAGNAEPVKITVSQAAGSGETPVDKAKGELTAEKTSILVSSEDAVTVDFKVVLDEVAKEDISVTLSLDEAYLAEYNYLNGESHVLFPAGKVEFAKTITVKAGETEALASLNLTPEALEFATGYLVPILAESDELSLKNDGRLNIVVMKIVEREVKNVLYFEVNDTNPLNALEYKLSDGTPFFDAVILFAANINYDSVDDVVYLHNNPNVQALLDESEVYIQPLRKAGIKVYLGLLGNHDAAGLCQLSDWGAAEWAKEVALVCKEYKLDGVNLDDEYSTSPILDNKWFAPRSSQQGGRLMYELKKELKRVCSWPTEVSHFDWGALSTFGDVTDQETGEVHTPAEFCDFHVANYGWPSSPFGDLTLKQCSGFSVQCNTGQGGTITESMAEKIKNDGYGWIMWFAFDPSGTGGIRNNRERSMNQFRNVAKACYGLELLPPTGVYNKIGEGKYDPVRYELESE